MAHPWPYPRRIDGHADFDLRFTELVDDARHSRWDAVAEQWPQFAEDLEAHLSFEEREMFGAYARQGRDSRRHVRRLEADHATIRQRIAQLSEEIAGRRVTAETIGQFALSLQKHSRREEETIYDWLERRGRRR